jgi:hypothetical protein
MTVSDLKKAVAKLDDDSEIVVAVPPKKAEGVYKIAMILPLQKKPTILLGKRVFEDNEV